MARFAFPLLATLVAALKSTVVTVLKSLRVGKFNLVSLNVKKRVYGFLKVKNGKILGEERLEVPAWEVRNCVELSSSLRMH